IKGSSPVLSFILIVVSLYCFGCASSRSGKHATATTVFNVRDYGALGNGASLDSPAINRAIEAAAAEGGGTVLIPAGTYLSGSIRLKNNIHLVIDTGARILGAPQDMSAYDAEEDFAGPAFQDGGHTYFHNSLIWGENLTNVFITGNGIIQGSIGATNEDGKERNIGLSRGDGIQDRVSGFNNFGKATATQMGPGTNKWPQRLGNKAIALKLCKNVLIRDITIFRGGHFAILVTGCDNMTVDNVTMDTDRDGIDIDGCRNTMVSNCRINSPNDDGLCPKSTYALGRPAITENLTIVNCQVSGFNVGTLLDGTMVPSKNANGRIKFGTESSGGYRNCTIANCTFRACRGLALEEVDGGIMENITVDNITMMDTPAYAIYITTGKRNRTPDLKTVSHARNIHISNVIADGVGKMSGIQVMGLPELPVEGVRLDNIRLISKGGGTAEDAAKEPKELGTGYPEPRDLGTLPAYGVYARHVKGLELANVQTSFLTNDLRSAIAAVDVDGLEIDNFKGQVGDGAVASKFENVRGLVIRNSPVLEIRPQ
ncbi:MAG TPA: glycosyl hydrolase family 28-related protein, partial [Desulfuromonadaceae bacterium]|nr:glycosyl hydrolase family 28-related protein [Desulfuromonadaceae bacterium]